MRALAPIALTGLASLILLLLTLTVLGLWTKDPAVLRRSPG